MIEWIIKEVDGKFGQSEVKRLRKKPHCILRTCYMGQKSSLSICSAVASAFK